MGSGDTLFAEKGRQLPGIKQKVPLGLFRSLLFTWSLAIVNSTCQPALWPFGSALNQRESGKPSWTNPPNARMGRCGAITASPVGHAPATSAPVQPRTAPPAASSGPPSVVAYGPDTAVNPP